MGEFVVWRIVPVSIWEPIATINGGWPPPIAELGSELYRDVRAALSGKVPRGLFTQGRLRPHTLFTFLVSKPHHIGGARRWLAEEFLDDVLPTLLEGLEARVGELLSRRT